MSDVVMLGDINVDMSEGSTWMEKVKSHLFTGGIDPNYIRAKLQKRSSDKGSLIHNRELKQLETDVAKEEQTVNELREKRSSILDEEKQVKSLQKELEMNEETCKQLEKELEQIKKEIFIEDKIAQRKRLDAILAFLDNGHKLENEINTLDDFKNDQIKSFDDVKQQTK